VYDARVSSRTSALASVALALAVGLVACRPATHPFVPHPISADAIRKACAMAVSCLSEPVFQSGASCAALLQQGLATQMGIAPGTAADAQRFVDCAAKTSDCNAVFECASQRHGPSWCATRRGRACDGDLLVSCLGGWGVIISDCAALGERCSMMNGSGTCTDGAPCDASAPPACGDIVLGHFIVADHASHLRTCDSTTQLEALVDCGDLFREGSCASQIVDGTQAATCIPQSIGMCHGPITCNGSEANVCENNQAYEVDCSGIGTCFPPMSDLEFPCAPTASDCTTMSRDSCAPDGTLEICVNGRWAPTSCPSIGLTTCEPTVLGARCR
jgi:hypothetical protein